MDIMKLPLMEEFIETAATLHSNGWAAGSSGNMSMLLDDGLEGLKPTRSIPLEFFDEYLEGRSFVITGSGKRMRDIAGNPADTLGILQVSAGEAELLWGFEGGAEPSSELFVHLRSHSARLSVRSEHRVLIHAHTPSLIAMSMVHPLEEKLFTQTLWSIMTECIVTFPDGVALLPWIPTGTGELADESAAKIRSTRLALWAHHGVLCAGDNPREALDIIETAEKAAEICIKTAHLPLLSRIEDKDMMELAQLLGLRVHPGYLQA